MYFVRQIVYYKLEILKFEHTSESVITQIAESESPEFLIQSVWEEAQELAFATSFQV